MITDLIGGQVTIAISSMANRSLVEPGKLVALAYTGDKRSPLMPNIPTAKEQGVPHVSSGWFGFAIHRQVCRRPVRDKLIAALTSSRQRTPRS
jgi:tripartite-type tricarboxylate transporter receptor subunit TctC